MGKLLNYIQSETATKAWRDGMWHSFKFDSNKMCYYVVHYTEVNGELKYKSAINERLTNDSITITGITAYATRNLGRPEKEVFDEYYSICRDKYISKESNKVGASLRNMEREFVENHLQVEDVNRWNTKVLAQYITDDELGEIDQIVETYRSYFLQKILDLPEMSKRIPSVQDELKTRFIQNGFFDLRMVKELSTLQATELLKNITKSDLGYAIAMLDHLNFITEFTKQNGFSLSDRNKELAKWFNTTARTIKGNVNVLTHQSKENRDRYKSWESKETVIKYYRNLKSGPKPL